MNKEIEEIRKIFCSHCTDFGEDISKCIQPECCNEIMSIAREIHDRGFIKLDDNLKKEIIKDFISELKFHWNILRTDIGTFTFNIEESIEKVIKEKYETETHC